MHSVKELMFGLFGGLLFVAAVSLLMWLASDVDKLSESVSSTDMYETSLVRESQVDEASEPVVTYADVMSVLMSDRLPYDIEIDGMLIDADTYNLSSFSDYSFPEHSTYTVGYAYGADGKTITKVIFWGN